MRFLLATFWSAAAITLITPAYGATPPVPGTRSLGLGGALRGAATGDSALTLNPSGMSLMRAYVIEGSYLYDGVKGADGHLGRLSIVDSTSGFNIAGGVYYQYLSQDLGGGVSRAGHEGGVALSIPLGEHLFIGGAAKYLRLTTEVGGAGTMVKGFTFDAGLTVKPVGSVTIGVAGQNLVDKHTDRAPRTVGGGITVGATSDLLLAADAVLDFTTRRDATGGASGKVWSFMGGAEYLFAKKFALRAGGGRRGYPEAGYLAVGASYIAQIGAIDFGFQRDLGGSAEETLIGASARLFLPAPE